MNSILKSLLVGEPSFRPLLTSTVLITFLSGIGFTVYPVSYSDKINKIIFQPPTPSYKDSDQILKITTASGHRISAMYLPNPGATFTVLYSHGNAEDLGTVKFKMHELREMGFAVIGYDYEGYGTSEGKPSEGATYRDVAAVYGYLTTDLHIPAHLVIAWGFSLGGAVAADLAARKPVAGLVLESTFVSAFRVVTRAPLLPFDKFRTLSKLKDIHCPVLVMHGTADEVIGFWHGRELFEKARQQKRQLWVEGAGHGDLAEVAGERYRKALSDFTALLKQR